MDNWEKCYMIDCRNLTLRKITTVFEGDSGIPTKIKELPTLAATLENHEFPELKFYKTFVSAKEAMENFILNRIDFMEEEIRRLKKIKVTKNFIKDLTDGRNN